jgi:hypothetical protein
MRIEKKAAKIVESIVSANDEIVALGVLKNILQELYLTSDYTFLVGLKDKLNTFEAQFKGLCDRYKNSQKSYSEIDDIRTECVFLYRDINDELSFDIDRLKIHYENDKTVRRYDAMESLKGDNPFNSKSASAVRELIGGDPGYKEYVSLAAISYGLWKEKGGLMDTIKLFTDSLASRARKEFTIESQDAK